MLVFDKLTDTGNVSFYFITIYRRLQRGLATESWMIFVMRNLLRGRGNAIYSRSRI